jgi:hypothetical protein
MLYYEMPSPQVKYNLLSIFSINLIIHGKSNKYPIAVFPED